MAEQFVFTEQENLSHARGTEFSAFTAGTGSGATATKAATTGATHKICWATFWSDTDSLCQILGGAAGATVLWEGKLDVGVAGFTLHVTFPVPIFGTVTQSVAAKVATSTSDCGAAIGGFSTKVLG